jgi:hypothetical protein
MSKRLSAVVDISRRFLRSVRIDADYGRLDAIEGFVLQPSAGLALEIVAKHLLETQQRAFTWTGPYGGGKSSLALVLASLVSSDRQLRQAAKLAARLEKNDAILKAFDASDDQSWTVLPIVGKRASFAGELEKVIDALPRRRKKAPQMRGARNIISELVALAESSSRRGVLLLIDELGKFLEHSARQDEDVYIYQELAEAASRAKGRLVVIGILHQPFEQYASRLDREARDEWTKVQGRYIDISLAAGSDEVLDLIGKAITNHSRHPNSTDVSNQVAASIATRRSVVRSDLGERIDACWPLHPVTAILLGPSAKRRFGQNERSVFGFLNSAEPGGFREYLDSTDADRFEYFSPWHYWDYLRTNFEPAILSSPDGHRWALGVEAIERAEAKADQIQIQIVKTVALVEMFRDGSGLLADTDVLQSCFPSLSAKRLKMALDGLSALSILIFRRHLSSWGIYAGSDFDIEAATQKALIELGENAVEMVVKTVSFPPVLAKRLYQQQGSMRFFARTLVTSDQVESYVKYYRPKKDLSGEFLLVLPTKNSFGKHLRQAIIHASSSAVSEGIVLGTPADANGIVTTATELVALEHVSRTYTELETDRVAAKEVNARLEAYRIELEDALRDSFGSAEWYWRGKPIEGHGSRGLSQIASQLGEHLFPKAPTFKSELINREYPSSNSVKARRDLLHRMLNQENRERLGYEGYPPDAGIYMSILQATQCHRAVDGTWKFIRPNKVGLGSTLQAWWSDAEERVLRSGTSHNLYDLYEIWSAPPYGIKGGVLPIVALAFYLAHKRNLAVYHDGIFTPQLGTVQVDEWLQDPKRVEWRYVALDKGQAQFLSELSEGLSRSLNTQILAEPLDSARALVSFVLALPEWVKRTNTISRLTALVRDNLLRANDPNKVLFLDLPTLLERSDLSALSKTLFDCLNELTAAYPSMIDRLLSDVLASLDHQGDLQRLQRRAKNILGGSGDFRLDAFILRISELTGEQSDVESLISLAANKPPREWNDRDIQAASIQLNQWSLDFRRVEALAPIEKRPAMREAFAVVFGNARGNKTRSTIVDVGEDDAELIQNHLEELRSRKPKSLKERKLFLAALIELGAELVEEQNGEFKR